MNQRINNNRKILIILMVAVALLVMGLTIYKQLGHRDEVQALIEQEQQILTENKQLVTALDKLKAGLEKSASEVLLYEQIMPKMPDENSIIRYLHETANHANIEFGNLSFEPIVYKSKYAEIPIKMSFKGNYICLMAFLGDLEHGKRLIAIDNLSMKRDSVDFTNISMEISARAFFVTESNAVENAEDSKK